MRYAASDMKEVFVKCQDKLQYHPRLMKSLEKVYKSLSLEDFSKEFFKYLNYSLIVLEKQTSVERTLDFVVKFTLSVKHTEDNNEKEPQENELEISSDEEDIHNPFLLKLFEYLLNVHCSKSQAVRFRSCLLINKLLNGLNNNVVIDEILFQHISQAMLERMKDKSAAVRVHAVHALNRLQDPSDPSCPVIQAYLYHLSHDPHPDVRRAILNAMGASAQTLQAVIERTRDVKDVVRRAAYQFLADKVHVRTLTISQREKLLQEGLKDRSDIVQKIVGEKLLSTWLKLYNNDILDFLRSLDVQDSSEVAQLAMNTLFKFQTPEQIVSKFSLLNEENLIPAEKLTFESVFYWRCVCQYIKNADSNVEAECLDRLLPTLTSFCHYVKSYISQNKCDWDVEKRLEHDFVCQQLLNLAGEFDLADQAGRKCLTNLVQDLLLSPEVDASLVKLLVTCYTKVKPRKEDLLCGLAEIIADVREPITLVENEVSAEVIRDIELKMAKVRVEINVLREEMNLCVSNQEYSRAQELKEQLHLLENTKEEFHKKMLPCSQEVRTEKNDPQTLLKCVTIVCEMIQQAPLKALNPTLHALIESLLFPGIQNEDPAVRNKAVQALGLCCLLSFDLATQHLILFLQISQVDQEVIQVTALQVIFDLLLFYGPDAFHNNDKSPSASPNSCTSEPFPTENFVSSSQDSNNQALSNLMSILAAQLDSELQDVRAVTAAGIGKMLLMERLYSPRLFSRLLLMWFNPTTENDAYLRHFLGVFLPAFSHSSRSNQECIEQAFLPTLQTLFGAPSSSPLAKIDPWNVSRFLIHLTSSQLTSKANAIQESTSHDRLAVQLCNEILQNPDSFNVRVLSKSLCALTITPSSSSKDLSCLSSKLVKEVKDKTCLKVLEKFDANVQKILATLKGSERNTPTMDQEPPNSATSILSGSQVTSVGESTDAMIEDVSSQTSSGVDANRNSLPESQESSDKDFVPLTPPVIHSNNQNVTRTCPVRKTRRNALSLSLRRKSTK